MTRHTKNRNGFTLIETMIAVTIITFAVAGPLFTASRAIVAAQTVSSQLTASNLAQEGVEFVRAMRDKEYLSAFQAGGQDISTTAWTNFTSGAGAGSVAQCFSPVLCSLDPTLPMGYGSASAVYQCASGVCGTLYLLPNGIYTLRSTSGGTQTAFTRSIQVFSVSANEVRVVSRVSWSFHGVPYSVSATSHLSSWQ